MARKFSPSRKRKKGVPMAQTRKAQKKALKQQRLFDREPATENLTIDYVTPNPE